MIVDLINADLAVNEKTIPDISVGKFWGEHWTKSGFDLIHGDQIKYEHNYPSYYRQSASNPQQPWAYPNEALAEFRRWFRHEYLTTRFPRYILTKAHLLGGQEKRSKSAISINRRRLRTSDDRADDAGVRLDADRAVSGRRTMGASH